MRRLVYDRFADRAEVVTSEKYRTVDVIYQDDMNRWKGDKAQALELAKAIREAAESLPDPPPDPWALLEEIVEAMHDRTAHGHLRRQNWMNAGINALKWHRENGGEP